MILFIKNIVKIIILYLSPIDIYNLAISHKNFNYLFEDNDINNICDFNKNINYTRYNNITKIILKYINFDFKYIFLLFYFNKITHFLLDKNYEAHYLNINSELFQILNSYINLNNIIKINFFKFKINDKILQNLLNNNFSLKSINLLDTDISYNSIDYIANKYPLLEDIYFNIFENNNISIANLINKCKYLKKIKFSYYLDKIISFKYLEKIKDLLYDSQLIKFNADNLKTIKLTNINSAKFQNIINKFNNIKNIIIYDSLIDDNCINLLSNLKKIKIETLEHDYSYSFKNLKKFFDRNRNITYLDLDFYSLNNKILIYLARKNKNLKKLYLSAFNIDIESIKYIIKRNHGLQKIKLYYISMEIYYDKKHYDLYDNLIDYIKSINRNILIEREYRKIFKKKMKKNLY